MSCEEFSLKNTAAVVKGNGRIDLITKQLPELGDNDVLVSMTAVGICGSDLKYWKTGKCGRFSLDGQAMVIGHEGAGRVVRCGPGVRDVRAGDRVAIEPGVSCRACEYCDGGRYNLCEEMRFCATPPVDGNLCRYYVHDADFCFKLPENVSDEEGAMVEPLSVAVHTCARAGVAPNNRVLIFGSGPIGILCGLVAKTMGASRVLIIDIAQHRLDDAARYEAADLFHRVVEEDRDPAVLSEKLKNLLGHKLPHAALECSGADSSLLTAMKTIGRGGSVMLVGRGSPLVPLPMIDAGTFEIDIKGIFRYANTYPRAIEMISKGEVNVKQLISHRFDLDQSQCAFETALDPSKKAIKVMISCDSNNNS